MLRFEEKFQGPFSMLGLSSGRHESGGPDQEGGAADHHSKESSHEMCVM